MIQSGRTKSFHLQMVKWYYDEFANIEKDWIWEFNEKNVERILDERVPIPFKRFFIRYLLEVHSRELIEKFPLDAEKGSWVDSFSEKLFEQIDSGKAKKYDDATEELQILTDLVFDDFISNGFVEKTDEINGEVEKVRACIDRNVTKSVGVLNAWTKDHLLRKITADRISEEELWAFGFGLNIACDDLSFFLKKAFRRNDFNLWNSREFLLYITFKYAQGNLFEFFEKLRSGLDEVEPKEWSLKEIENFSTANIGDRASLVMKKIEEKCYCVALDENGELPLELVDFLGEYKYLTENSEDYTRTATEECARLLASFEENVKDQVECCRRELDSNGVMSKTDENLLYATGEVEVFYDPKNGVNIPEGTCFYKYKKLPGYEDEIKEIAFEVEESVSINGQEGVTEEVRIPVKCAKETQKQGNPEDDYGFATKNSEFKSADTFLSKIHNEQNIKTPNSIKRVKVEEGSLTCASGYLFAECELNHTIKEGTEFYLDKASGERVTYVSTKSVSTNEYPSVKLWVKCTSSGEEAVKGEIKKCSIPESESSIKHIENTKIGFRKKKEEQKTVGGALYNYLYKTYDAFSVTAVVDVQYFSKLCSLLKDLIFSSTKLNQIKNKSIKNVSRNDLLVMSFLEYMSDVEKQRIEEGEDFPTTDEYISRLPEFHRRTDALLKKCGFLGLYAPNPQDSLIVCLLSSNGAVDAYRNICTWYMKYTQNTQKTEEEVEG